MKCTFHGQRWKNVMSSEENPDNLLHSMSSYLKATERYADITTVNIQELLLFSIACNSVFAIAFSQTVKAHCKM